MGVSPDNPTMTTRCAFCDDRLCIERNEVRRTFFLDGKFNVDKTRIIDCPQHRKFRQYLNGEIKLEEALEGDR